MSRKPLLASASLVMLALAGCLREGGKSVDPDFPTDVEGLEFAKAPEVIELEDGDTLILTSAPVKKMLKGVEVRMLGYNGSIPGPTLRVKQHSRLTLRIRNRSGLPSSLHSHGVRMDYRSDGAATTAASAIPDRGSQDYDLTFPDAGLYWYHPHFRQDYALEMGQYGNILVAPADTGYWGPVDRETLLMLDDFYLDPDRKTAPFRRDAPDRNLMGRFGNLYLINGDTAFTMTVKRKERVRFLATNSCNTRVINLEFRDPAGAVSTIKIVGSDNGPYEWFDTAGSTTVAPSERKVFEAYFEKEGTYRLVNHMLGRKNTLSDSTAVLGTVTVLADSVSTGLGEGFLGFEGSSATRRSMDSVRTFVDPAVPFSKELLLTGTMGMGTPKRAAQPEPISIEAKGIDWYDHMADMNEISGPHNTTWAIRDLETGKENHDIYWSFERGSKVKIRIRNDPAATHPMPHPIHFHGQRFLIAAVNGRRNLNLAWKDTYLVGTAEIVDILLDAWNPGEWMAHCHIAEHHESMMMFHFRVE